MGSGRLTGTPSLLRLTCILSLLLLVATLVSAELLPVKTFTTADGLLRDSALCIVQDSRGFLWFCTSDGLSRFDGYGFTNYTTDDGLPHRVVNTFLQTRGGVYWVGTNQGLARLNPKGQRASAASMNNQELAVSRNPMFVTYSPQVKGDRSIEVLFEDAQGKLWCGTDDGLYWFEEQKGAGVFHRVDLPKERLNLAARVSAIIQDRQGNLWIGTDDGQGLNRLRLDGRIEHYAIRQGKESKSVKALLETSDGKIWVGTSAGGVCELVSDPNPSHTIVARCFTKRDGLAENWIENIYQASDGKLWFSSTLGITTFNPDAPKDESRFHTYRDAQGLCDGEAGAVREDRDGNVWISTICGIKKITRTGFVRFGQADGLASLAVNGIFSSRAGELFVISKQAVDRNNRTVSVHSLNRFYQNRFTFATPGLPQSVSTGWGGGQIAVQDKGGDWWLPGDERAIYRFPKVAKLERLSFVKPQTIPIPDKEVFRIYEDSHGNVWISTMYEGHLLKWERATETINDYRDELANSGVATCFAEDRAGNLWVGFDYGNLKLASYRNGRVQVISSDELMASGGLTSLYFDHAGRLWLTSRVSGAGVIGNPGGEPLNIVWYNRRKGLATDSTACVVEDKFGRIYVGHGRGVDRIEPNTGQIRHYSSTDGLGRGPIQVCVGDKGGALWFSSSNEGVSRLVPEAESPRQTPNILLTGLRVAGTRQTVSELGETNLPALNLDANQTHVSISFLGLGASLGEELKYQYKLEGTGGDWIETAQRSVDFANLSPGSYRFQVSAVTFDGLVSQTPASISFTIAPPIWQRWWFLLIVATALTLILVTLYRYRVRRLLELERIRTRIASDLHDDIGASLSRIAIMSEVVKRQVTGGNGESGRLLTDIADSARELTGSMRDIVWAIDPRRDDLGSVVSRIRQFASDVLEAKDIKWDFQTPAESDKIQLGPDQRRHILLFFKEAITNIARHSDCRTVNLSIDVDHGSLIGEVRDDGQGLDLQPAGHDETGSGGHGLESMRRRVTQLGGKFSVDSARGAGTSLKIIIPVKKP